MKNSISNNLFVGKVLHEFEELDSTNSYLMAMAANSNPPEGTVVLAAKQSAGRGQYGSVWFTGAGGNLAASFLFRPKFVHLSLQFLLSQTFSLGALDALNTFTTNGFFIKWPNDLYFNGKKIGGMLIENSISSGRFQHSVLGLGINVEQLIFPEFLPTPVSLRQILGENCPTLPDFLGLICTKMEARYLQLRRGDIQSIRRDYHENLFRLNQRSRFIDAKNQTHFEALPRGVEEESGRLILETATNTFRSVDLKEVIWVMD